MIPKLNKSLIFLIVGRAVQAVVSILTLRMMTEHLDQTEVGNQYIINSMILWFSLVLINPVGMFVNRHVHEWFRQGQLFSAVKKLNLYFLIVAVISIPILLTAKAGLGFGGQLPVQPLLIYVGFYIFLSTWFQTLVSFFNLFEFQKQFVSLNIFSQAAGLILARGLVAFMGPTGLNWLVGLLAGQVLSLLLGTFLFKKYFAKTIDDAKTNEVHLFTKETFSFCYPVAISTLFMWFLSQGYRLYIEKYLGVESVASLGVGLGVAASIAALVEALTTQYFYPKFYGSIANSTQQERQLAWSVLWKNSARIYIPVFFLTIATALFLVKALTAQQFHHVVPFVIIGAGIELCRQLSNIAYLASHAEKNTKNTILPYISGAVVLLGLLFALQIYQQMYVINVIIALLVAGLVTLLTNLISVRRILKGAHFHLTDLLLSLLVSIPILLILFFTAIDDSILKLFGASFMAGLYCLLVIRKTVKI